MSRPRGSSQIGAELPGDTRAPALMTRKSYSRDLQNAEYKATRTHSKRRKAKSFLQRTKYMCLKHTWIIPLLFTSLLLGTYLISPGEHNPLHPYIFLSYKIPKTIFDSNDTPSKYGKGIDDIKFVAFYTIVFSFTREFTMQKLILPIAKSCGITRRAKQARFMEQVYTAIYHGTLGSFGLYVMKHAEGGSLWYFATTSMFEGFPHRAHDGIFKAYYLLQAAYWTQQAIVLLLQLEQPRKDFKELVLHHVVTLSLIGLSYRFHFARMGIAVFITHDVSDFFLATSKTLNYLDAAITGPYFALFIGVWIYTRHYINLHILWATLTEFRTVGPFDLDWETQQYKCWISQYITFGLLASLQLVNLFWLYLILRIAKNYVFNKVAQDERSDDEAEAEEEKEIKGEKEGMNGDVKKQIEAGTPVVLINGEPVGAETKSEGAVKRRKG